MGISITVKSINRGIALDAEQLVKRRNSAVLGMGLRALCILGKPLIIVLYPVPVVLDDAVGCVGS